MATVPVIVELANGFSERTSINDARKPGLNYNENIDFSHDGELRGRPSFATHHLFGRRDTKADGTNNTDLGTVEPDTVGLKFNYSALFRCRDTNGERPGVVANGRVWTWEGTRWADKLYCGSARQERLVDFTQGFPTASDRGPAVAYNYMSVDTVASGQGTGQGTPMLGAIPGVTNYQTGAGTFLYGGSCVADSGGTNYYCTVGNNLANNNLTLVVRTDFGDTLSTFVIAADAAVPTFGAFSCNAPTCCSDRGANSAFGVPTIWVAYQQNAAANIVFLRVRVDTGAVVAGPVNMALANVIGLWIASDGLNNRLVGAFTQTATNGVACRTFDATTLALNAAKNAQLDGAAARNALGPVTIGLASVISNSEAIVTYQTGDNAGLGTAVVIGRYDFNTPATTIYRTFGDATGAVILPGKWMIAHQPISVHGPKPSFSAADTSNTAPRCIVGLYYGGGHTSAANLWTWFAVDITDMMKTAGSTFQWGTKNPGILACGPIDGSKTTTLPGCAMQPNNGGPSYRFGTLEWRGFTLSGGDQNAAAWSWGLNEVTLVCPRAASIGEETVISGSWPHSLAKGMCFDTQFSQIAPELIGAAAAGGGLLLGTYSFAACWRYTDDAGFIHRSAPSQLIQTISAAAGQKIVGSIQNLQLHNKEAGKVYLELYAAGPNPTAVTPLVLVQTVEQVTTTFSTAFTYSTVTTGGISLYTNNGAILSNLPVSADGGVATVGRRMWVSDGKAVYASKLFAGVNNNAVAWNDDGPLVLKIPTPAGRVLALENMDDKLVILCQRGIFTTQGDGPEDSGLGSDFLVPVQVSQLGVSHERGSILTQAGVAFHSPNTQRDAVAGSGGVFLLTRGLGLQELSANIQDQLSSSNTGTTVVELSCIPERNWLVINPEVIGSSFSSFSRYLYVLDMRTTGGQWSKWTNPNGDFNAAQEPGNCITTCGINGVLWGCFDGQGTVGKRAVGAFEGVPGIDEGFFTGDTTHSYRMFLRTNNIYANNSDGLGWARVRSITVLGGIGSTHTTTMTVVQDQTSQKANVTDTYNQTAVTLNATWPTNRASPEFRLSNPKCSQIQVSLGAVPARAQWAALRLDTIPSRVKAPTTSARH